jgi:tetratricopeptide (TPR) repeat protein
MLIILLVISSMVTSAAASKRPVLKPAVPIARLGSDPLSRSAFSHFYSMEFDKAVSIFEQVARSRPDDPFAVNHLATAVLYRELYRIGAMDTELFADEGFLSSRHLPVDPAIRQRVRLLTDRSVELCDKRLKANPNDLEALYARGVARGTRSVATGMLEKSWFAALRSAVGARRDHERVLELDPGYTDAKLIVGVHNYIMGSLSWAVKMAASVMGLGGSKQKGIQYLYDAVNGGGEASIDARIALSLFLRREQRYQEAIGLVSVIGQAYPRNFLVALEYANLLNAAGRAPEAIAAYHRLLNSGKDGLYVDPRLEQAAYMLGEALRGQNDFRAAAEAFEMVNGYPKADPALRSRANLAAGQMYDLLQNRELARARYQAVIAADADSPDASKARKYLKQPYRLGRKG